MASESNADGSAFTWNQGGWFGAQIGSTLWLLILGFVVLSKDLLAATVCVGGFVALNAWGLILWRSRDRVSAYAAFQRFLVAASVIIAVVVVVVNARGLSHAPTPGSLVSTYLPYWTIGFAPALSFLFFWRERSFHARRSGLEPNGSRVR